MRLFEIPVIQPDLRHEESILQSINTLDYLNDVINQVFDRIDARISKNNKKIQDINQRITVANNKIDTLKNTKKAVTVYSTSKYPGDVKDFVPTFSVHEKIVKCGPKKLSENDVKSSPEKLGNKKPHEKLQFYNVKFSEKERINRKSTDALGINIPLDIVKSVDSLIIFKNGDKLEKSKNSSASSVLIDGGRKLEAAPTSISSKNQKKQLDSIFYTPSGVDNAPELNVPLDLPDLPGIAGDIMFNTDDDFLIVPSRSSGDTVSKVTTPPELVTSPTNVVSVDNVSQKEPEALQPIVPVQKKELEPQKVVPKEEYIIPPPPPPPSMAVPKLDLSKLKQDPSKVSNARLNLLADIRNAAGKTKLRPAAADRNFENEKKKEKPPPPEDFISDLRNRLQMRRQGISGSKDQEQSGNILTKLVSIIPPPNTTNEKPSKQDSDEDWQ